ncbi:MAG: hypothetical protein COB20_13480 [SAR86 cluster bacterium]|uniref:Uncharacterized protein n=1 Tax=SAR86 cluster bacterium TaxID=2030880 RepID=A0A2A4WYN7_9GAMM|nr:MAG: hypothetical protein COB20_13480 [SAR86 cluster bacterium]
MALANGIAVTGDTVTISASAGGFNQAKSLLTTPGTIPNTDGIPTASITSDLTFTFNVAAATGSTIAAGTYSFQGGMFIDQDGSARRLEISVSGISLTFDALGNITSGSIAAGTNAVVSGRSADGGATAVITLTNNLLSITDATFSITAGAQIAEIEGSANIILQDLTTTFTAAASYDYGIFLKQTGGVAGLTFGLTDGTTFFGCAAANPMALAGQSSFTGASALAGRMGVGQLAGGSATAYAGSCITVPAIGGGGGGGGGGGTSDTPTVEEQQQVAQESVNELNTIDFNNVTDNDIVAIVMVLDEIVDLGGNTVAGIEDGDVNTNTALNVVETITDVLQVTGAATQGGGDIDSDAINSTLNGITDIFDALDEAGDGLNTAQIETVQSLTETTLTAVTELFTDTTTISETESLITSVSSVINSAIKVGASLDSDLLSSAENLVQTALENTLSDIAKALDDSLNITFENITTTQTLLSNNTRLLSSVLDSISIKLSSSISLDQSSTQSTLESSGLNTDAASRLTSDLAQFVNPTGVSLTNSSGTITAQDTIESSLGGGSTVSTDATTGLVTVKTATETYPVAVRNIAIVPASIPEGTTDLPDGSRLFVGNGIATNVVPAPQDPVGFASALADFNADVAFSSNGGVNISNDSLTFSGSFDFKNIGSSSSASTGDVTFSSPTGSPADPSYSHKVNYPDGTSQNLLPFVKDNDFFDSIKNAGFDFSTKRSTGVVKIFDSGSSADFKPDYFVEPLSSTDSTFLQANKDSTGTAYRPGDYNNDGVTDYEVVSDTGKQIVYGVP